MSSLDTRPAVRPTAPPRALAVVGLGGCWAALALAETVIGDLDTLSALGPLSESPGRIVVAGLLHLLAGVLLVLGVAGVAGAAWASRLGRAGVVLCALLAVGLGGFGMLHLLTVEMTAAIDPDAISGALDRGDGRRPAWQLPVAVVALGGGWLLAVLLAGLARLGLVPWASVGVVAAGALLHFFKGDGPLEYVAHWVVAAGMVLAMTVFSRRASRIG